MYKLQGTLKVVKATQQVSEKFSKREFVVTIADGNYTQDIMLEMTQDKCDLLNAMMEGQEVEVSFSLRGREWTSPQGDVKYFNTLNAFRIESLGSAPAADPLSDPLATESNEEGDQDLPF